MGHPVRRRAWGLPYAAVMATTLEPRLARRSITLVHRAPLGPIDRERRSRRCLNIAAATVGIVLTLPLMLVIAALDRKSTRLNSSHSQISYAVFCLKKKNKKRCNSTPQYMSDSPIVID